MLYSISLKLRNIWRLEIISFFLCKVKFYSWLKRQNVRKVTPVSDWPSDLQIEASNVTYLKCIFFVTHKKCYELYFQWCKATKKVSEWVSEWVRLWAMDKNVNRGALILKTYLSGKICPLCTVFNKSHLTIFLNNVILS